MCPKQCTTVPVPDPKTLLGTLTNYQSCALMVHMLKVEQDALALGFMVPL